MSQPNVWIIDHRDSFTWNLAELVRVTGMAVPRVVSNLSPELEQAVQAGEKLILSPGPGTVEFPAGLYHSWRLAATPWPEELVVTARDSGGNIQAIRHRFRPLYGIQFHPESILTPDGKSLLRNFLSLPANAVEGSPASNESMVHSQHQG